MEKKNVTIVLDEETARWARLEAARRNTSVSQLVGGLLREHMVETRRYEAARRRYMAVEPYLDTRGEPLPRRDELHERGIRADREGAG